MCGYFMQDNAMGPHRKLFTGCIEQVDYEQLTTRWLWPPRPPNLNPWNYYLSRTIHIHWYPRKKSRKKSEYFKTRALLCIHKYFHKVQDLLRSLRFAFPDFYKIRYLNWREKNSKFVSNVGFISNKAPATAAVLRGMTGGTPIALKKFSHCLTCNPNMAMCGLALNSFFLIAARAYLGLKIKQQIKINYTLLT